MINQFNASLWGDEGFSAILSMHQIPDIIKIIIKDTSPPLYNITQHVVFQFFGTSEVVIRSLSFFYYSLAIFFIFLTAKYLWNKKTAIIAATLTFLNPFFFIYAFEGRMYSLMALGVAMSMYFFTKLILPPQNKPSTNSLIGYIIGTSVALYSHHFAIFAIITQALWFIYLFFDYLFTKKRTTYYILRSTFLCFISVGILYTPWLYPLYSQTKMVGSGFWLGTPTIIDLRSLIYEYLAQGTHHPLSKYALYLVFSILLFRNWFKTIKITTILLSWFLVPILFTWFLSQYFQPIFYNRYLLYDIPGAMLILASNRTKFSYIPLSLIIAFFLIIDFHYFTHPTKPPFQDLANYVRETKRGDDILINADPGNHKLWESKYYGLSAPIYVSGKDNLPYFVGTALMEQDDVISKLPTNESRRDPFRVGAISIDSTPPFQIPGFTIEEQKQFGSLRFTWFSKI